MTTFEKALTAKPEFSGVSGHMGGETGGNALNTLGDVGKAPTRQMVQNLFIRICRDSQWSIDAIRAAKLTGQIVGKHPLLVWDDIGSLDIMHSIAAGEHPACHRAFVPEQPS